jgi:hypothetical protein
MYILKERREASLLLLSPTERYREFMADHPNVSAAIPQHYIASYLGIDPVSLSRIRGRNRKS